MPLDIGEFTDDSKANMNASAALVHALRTCWSVFSKVQNNKFFLKP